MSLTPLQRNLAIGIPTGLVVLNLLGMWWYNYEPPLFDPVEQGESHAAAHNHQPVTGFATTSALIDVTNVLLNKRGGYMSNDISPPWLFLDNVKHWEFGVLTQIRDLARSMRNDFSRSQTQSAADPDLELADPLYHYDSERWIPPDTEGRYRKARDHVEGYLARLTDPAQADAQFYARADNLAEWLSIVEKRLGSLSQRLSASAGQRRFNTDLSGESEARQSTGAPREIEVKTPWVQVDDVFYETRGTSWALIHFLKAMEIDFRDVLEKKNAKASFSQIIRELESTQEKLRSPMVLNGGKFSPMANHSLVMANYVSRANAAIIDLRYLLSEG